MAGRRIGAVIAAAGSSTRMGGGVKKQYLMYEDLPVLVRAVKAFCAIKEEIDTVVVCPPGDEQLVSSMLDEYGLGARVRAVVAGGDTRQESVRRGLAALEGCELVLVHDAARPFVTREVIEGVLRALESCEAAVPCVRPKQTIRTVNETLDRAALYEVQTPQGFRAETLRRALEKAERDGFTGTDEAGLVERIGVRVTITEGDYSNVKITTPEDLPREPQIRVGSGYDVHRLAEGRPLMLGCVNVPYERGLLGHSDADVLAHAMADALLGACALGDIGRHFPDSDPEFEGMSGARLLSETARIIRENGFETVNIDATLVAQRPKIAPYAEAMRKACAEALGVAAGRVSIKATTEEGLGITGDGNAMAAYATAAVKGK